MRCAERIVCLSPKTSVHDALEKITGQRCGSAIIIDEQQKLLGIFTDGDLRRALNTSDDANTVLSAELSYYATMPCAHTIGSALLQAALHICNEKKINELPVCDDDGVVIGMIDLQDLTDRGYL